MAAKGKAPAARGRRGLPMEAGRLRPTVRTHVLPSPDNPRTRAARPDRRVLAARRHARADAVRVERALAAVRRLSAAVELLPDHAHERLRGLRAGPAGIAGRRRVAVRPRRAEADPAGRARDRDGRD